MAKAKPAQLTLAETAEMLEMSTDDLMRSRWRGILPGSMGRKVGGELLFERVAVEAYRKSRTKPAKPSDPDPDPSDG